MVCDIRWILFVIKVKIIVKVIGYINVNFLLYKYVNYDFFFKSYM